MQVTLEMTQGPPPSPAVARARARAPAAGASLVRLASGSSTEGSEKDPSASVSLIVSFPQVRHRHPHTCICTSFLPTILYTHRQRFPTQRVPSFTVRGADVGHFAASLSAELAAVAAAALQPPSSSSSSSSGASGAPRAGFLLAIARCFCNRVSQLWSHQLQRDHRGTPDTPFSPGPASLDATPWATSGGSGEANPVAAARLLEVHVTADGDESRPKPWGSGEFDEAMLAAGNGSGGAAPADFIDPLAYRIPSPASSGAVFSPLGVLLCFGGATLHLPKDTPKHTTAAATAPTPTSAPTPTAPAAQPTEYPKSLADYLVQARMRAEQAATQAALAEEEEAGAGAGEPAGRRRREDGDEDDDDGDQGDGDTDSCTCPYPSFLSLFFESSHFLVLLFCSRRRDVGRKQRRGLVVPRRPLALPRQHQRLGSQLARGGQRHRRRHGQPQGLLLLPANDAFTGGVGAAGEPRLDARGRVGEGTVGKRVPGCRCYRGSGGGGGGR